MSRFLLLIILVLWMARTREVPVAALDQATATALFLGGFALVVLLMGVWSRVLARHVTGENLHRSVRRFTRAMYVARMLIPAWFGVGLFALGWPATVDALLGGIDRWPIELPGAILGTLPALAAWVGLWWAQYPADRALREQSVLVHLDEDLPIHSPPSFRNYISSNLRLQMLFTLVPIGIILAVRDIATMVLWKSGLAPAAGTESAVQLSSHVEASVSLGALALVFILAPEILRRVLKTQPLPQSALRNRLESMCRRSGLKYRDILLWHTENNMGNAAVMGIVPQVRYILLSDLLLETMTDQQIEAVFAHEVGHVVHRHMAWYAVFLVIILAGLLGPGRWIEDQLGRTISQSSLSSMLNLLTVVAGCGGFFLLFGCLSRWFERQADVYAARTMQHYEHSRSGFPATSEPAPSHVGPYGAELFASALRRVAVINNIPLEDARPWRRGVVSHFGSVIDSVVEQANNWFHGSIPRRMAYLRALSVDPARTGRFDRRMSWLNAGLVVVLLALLASFVASSL